MTSRVETPKIPKHSRTRVSLSAEIYCAFRARIRRSEIELSRALLTARNPGKSLPILQICSNTSAEFSRGRKYKIAEINAHFLLHGRGAFNGGISRAAEIAGIPGAAITPRKKARDSP